MRDMVFICFFGTFVLLTGCMTTGADPEKYSSLDCKAISDLSKSYKNSFSNLDLFNDNDINEFELTGTRDRILGQSRDNLRPYEKAFEKDINSLRAASRLKGC